MATSCALSSLVGPLASARSDPRLGLPALAHRPRADARAILALHRLRVFYCAMRFDDPVARIMSVPVYSVEMDEPTSKVRHLMKEHGFHHVPVVLRGVLVGLISASDLLHLHYGDFGVSGDYLDIFLDERYPIRELMSRDLVTLRNTDSIARAAELLSDSRLHALPVVGDGGRLKGLVTSTDLCRCIVLFAAQAQARRDAE